MNPKHIVILSLCAITSLLVCPQAEANSHEKTFGVQTGYISRNQSACAGLFFQYSFSEHFRLSPELNIAFKNDNRDALLIDLNAHFPIANSGVAEFYPLVGINYSSWSAHYTYIDDINSKDVTKRTTRLGLNIGGGMGMSLTNTLKLKLELGYSMVKSNNAFRATVGIGYIF